jgi:hypothetical protein
MLKKLLSFSLLAHPHGGAGAPTCESRQVSAMKRSIMKRSMKTTIASAVLAIGAGVAGTAESHVLYSTALDATEAHPSSGWSNSGPWTVYDAFTLGGAATITDFGYYSFFKSDLSEFTGTSWSIWSGAPQTGALIASADNAAGYAPPGQTSDVTLVTVSGLGVSLAAGAYYIGLHNNFTDSSLLSEYATTGAGIASAIEGVVGVNKPGYVQAAFYIDGSSVPEPSTWTMMLAGFAGLGWAARRRVARVQRA